MAPQAEVEAHVRSMPGTDQALTEICDEVARAAQGIAVNEAYDTGKYAASITHVHHGARHRARAHVHWAAPLEGGTGLYGPKRKLIRAAPGKRFVFKTRLPPPVGSDLSRSQAGGLGGLLRTIAITKHRGMPGRHIMQQAGELVAGASPRLRYRVRAWTVAE